MRRYFKMGPEHKGVLISMVAPLAPAATVLQRDDVLMSFDGIQIANDGTVPFRSARIHPLSRTVQGLLCFVTQCLGPSQPLTLAAWLLSC